MQKQLNQPSVLVWLIGISALILFVASGVRHELLNSGAWDLGIFDQGVYLISQGKSPISSFLGFHILADHAAWILYPIALLYKIYPSVYWLFAVQAIALAIAAWPTYQLAVQAGLKEKQAVTLSIVYLLYPLIFNISLFDFHPDVIAVPAILAAVLAARNKNIYGFCLYVLIVLGCKAVFGLTVAAMGVWLWGWEKRKLFGAIALLSGVTWFIISTQIIIPFLGSSSASVARHIYRYSYLGDSFSAIAQNLLSNPLLIFSKLFTFANLSYLLLLVSPVIWGLSFAGLTPLIAGIPQLALNLLADYHHQKNLIFQYSLPILPFLLLAVIKTLATGKGWLHKRKAIILWSLVAFLSLGKYGYFWSKYLKYLDNWQATREAIAQVQDQGSVYTTDIIAPHLSQRQYIQYTNYYEPVKDLNQFDYILLNLRHTGLWSYEPELASKLCNQVKNISEFELNYQRDDVYLFIKKSSNSELANAVNQNLHR
ncbi:MAG TPA: DUF2079 domain-containing protein [Nostocaceae cyanobacterium]|nr:DUF2079 domain-containing protein [Nostocaceae cyanobacterium]